MVSVPSTMLPLGTPLPAFDLVDAVDGKKVSSRDLPDSPALLVMFICNHCPYVIHVRPELERVVREFQPKGVQVVAINANSLVTHPQDGPENMRALAKERGWTFPFLFDESQSVAKAFKAACTPDFYVFDRARKLIYRGQLDDSRPKNDKPLDGSDLRAALEAAIAGKKAAETQKASIGCNIKWAPGNEPEWFGVPR